jgi:hypothetical protein
VSTGSPDPTPIARRFTDLGPECRHDIAHVMDVTAFDADDEGRTLCRIPTHGSYPFHATPRAVSSSASALRFQPPF